jgi:ribosome-associated toxin RatA of RatAB toxin-antitoxin module
MFRITSNSGGRTGARRFVVALVVVLTVLNSLALLAYATDEQSPPDVTVHEERGTYSVKARFHVPQPPSVAFAVLTDYDDIPRFMSDIKTSKVLERSVNRAVVEQEGVSRFMMFSKRVHLVLEITEAADSLRFRDRCGRSFAAYEGRWSIVGNGGGTDLVYELTANPSFSVPETILKRLLRRDSTRMIASLRQEMATRAPRPQGASSSALPR